MTEIQSSKSLLRRRKSLTSTFQAMVDGIIVLATVYLSFIDLQGFLSISDIIFLVSLLVTMGVTYDQLSIYRHFTDFYQSAKKLLLAWSASYGLIFSIFYMAKLIPESTYSTLFAIYLLAFTGQVLSRVVFYAITFKAIKSSDNVHNVLIVGDSPLVTYLHDTINNNPWIPERVVGRINIVDQEGQSEVPILGTIEGIADVIDEYGIRTVYITTTLENAQRVKEIYARTIDKNVDIHWAPNLYSMELINYSVKEIAGVPLLTLSETHLIGNHRLAKEIFDRVLSLLLIILFSPLMLAVAILIKLESPGPAIFKQDRTGWDGRIFRIWKFRSMKIHQEENGQVKQATKQDDRITRIGKFIRKTSLDELPQLFNVFSGKMSLVGPRPHAVAHNQEYSQRINSYLSRHRIKPGITGLAQVNGYRGETETIEKMENRVRYDVQYINNWSIWLDILILVKTVPALLRDEAY